MEVVEKREENKKTCCRLFWAKLIGYLTWLVLKKYELINKSDKLLIK